MLFKHLDIKYILHIFAPMEINEKLKELRRIKNLKQGQIAEKLGIAQSNYALWESGKTDITVSKLPILAEIFGVSVGELLGLEASVVANGGEARENEALKKEVERLKTEAGLYKELKNKLEVENNWTQESILEIMDYIYLLSQDTPSTFLAIPTPLFTVENKEAFTPHHIGTVIAPVSPQTFSKDVEYMFWDICDERLLNDYFFSDPVINMFFDRNLVKDDEWLKIYKKYKKNKPSKKEIAFIKAYQQKANDLWARHKTDIVAERQIQLITAWDYAQKVVQ